MKGKSNTAIYEECMKKRLYEKIRKGQLHPATARRAATDDGAEVVMTPMTMTTTTAPRRELSRSRSTQAACAEDLHAASGMIAGITKSRKSANLMSNSSRSTPALKEISFTSVQVCTEN